MQIILVDPCERGPSTPKGVMTKRLRTTAVVGSKAGIFPEKAKNLLVHLPEIYL